ncbi:MAG TPA: sulfotransferase [Gaiella sp.]
MTDPLRALRRLAGTPALYARTTARVLRRGRRAAAEERLVFVVGSPRSGTTFMGGALGSLPGFVDLGEVQPLKAAVPELYGLPDEEASERLRRALERVRRLALVRRLRGVEQTPETSFVLGAALRAYPRATAVHMVRDGRDVVCSLLERGWLSAGSSGEDDAGLEFGAHTRFWVEPGRVDEFRGSSDTTRAAWAWRRYVTAARAVPERTYELRYEDLVADPSAVAAGLAPFLGVDATSLASALSDAHDRSAGRWRRDLDEEQLADVERESGDLLRELGYND